MEEIVRVAEVFNIQNANLFKGILEENGIFCNIEGEHFANLGMTVPMAGNSMFLQVIHKDLNTAIPLLKDFSVNTGLEIQLLIDTA